MSVIPGPRCGRSVLVTLLLAGTVLGGTVAATAQAESVSLVPGDGAVVVHATEDATIRGTSDLPAGTTLSVTVESAGGTEPAFMKSTTATVREGGNFSVEVDLSDRSSGDAIVVTVRHNGTTVAESDGRVLAPGETVTRTSTDDTRTSTALPGFGLLAAVAALLGSPLVTRRR